MRSPSSSTLRRLILVLGDQLDPEHPALRPTATGPCPHTGCPPFDPHRDAVLMIEAPGEARHVWSHQARIALFLAAMRQFRDRLRREESTREWSLTYLEVEDEPEHPGLLERLARTLDRLRPERLVVLEPGEWRLRQGLEACTRRAGVALEVWPDPHFMCSTAEFATWARGQKQWRMEYFYRWMRKRHRVLLDAHGEPEGGRWNFDADNRQGYPRGGPGPIPPPARCEPDARTREVLALVARRFGDHPGSLASFAWPTTREQALTALETFIEHRLAGFGPYQDAMWTDTPWGWHALLASSLNLKLLRPAEVVAAAEAAWRRGAADLASVEGFIRQILGWREFIRGVYGLEMPGLAEANHYRAERPLPRWYWSGDTHMACLRHSIGQTLEHGYAHHIQRLMVLGLFALLAGIRPQDVADWFLAVYVDAVEWVELPNVAGMALYANGGRFTSKPYLASGAYIQRMSNYCQGCRYRPQQKTGPDACPYTTLYWDFLARHEAELAAHPRTALMVKNLARLGPAERDALAAQAQAVLSRLDTL